MHMQLTNANHGNLLNGKSCFESFHNGYFTNSSSNVPSALSPRSVAGGLAYFSDSTSESTTRSSWDSGLCETSKTNACQCHWRDKNAVRPRWGSNTMQEGTVRNLNFDQACCHPGSSPRVLSPFGARADLKAVNLEDPSEVTQTRNVSHCAENNLCAAKARPSFGHDLLSSVLPSADEVGLHQKISELRVALQASDSARQESERETEALRTYLANVEAGAATLHLRNQELEHQLRLAMTHDERDLEQLRGKIVDDASREAQTQAAAAAQAVVAAREATMELDKIKRHYSALVKSQEDEILRLRRDVENSRVLYQARAGQTEALKEQIEKLEHRIYLQSQKVDATIKDSKVDITEMQKQVDTLQLAAQHKEADCDKLKGALDITNNKAKTLERRLQEIESEKKDVDIHNEWLEQQVNELQNRQVMATIAHYDCELRKVRAALGGEKAHLLSELALLRCRNKSLRGDLAEWQEKYKALSNHVSGLETMSTMQKKPPEVSRANMEYHLIENPLWEDVGCKSNEDASKVIPGLPGEHLERTGPAHSNNDTKVKIKQEEGEKNRLIEKTCSCSCEARDNILAAAHREILKLNEINQWLIAACQK